MEGPEGGGLEEEKKGEMEKGTVSFKIRFLPIKTIFKTGGNQRLISEFGPVKDKHVHFGVELLKRDVYRCYSCRLRGGTPRRDGSPARTGLDPSNCNNQHMVPINR